MTPTYRILCGDARARLAELYENSVQMFITSVPYWSLRRYVDHPDEIGREDTLEVWLANLVDVFRSARRPLRPDGTLWINCGDSYAQDPKGPRGADKSTLTGPDWQLHAVPPGLQKGWRQSEAKLKRKDLLGLPWRLAFALQADGWYLRAAVPWIKGCDWLDAEREAQETIRRALVAVRDEAAGSLFGLSENLERALDRADKAVDRLIMSGAAMPESVTDRPVSAYEMLFLFSQREQYYFDHHAIKVPASPVTHPRGCGHTPKETEDRTTIRANSSFHEATYKHVLSTRNARNVWMIPWRIPVEPQSTFRLSSGKEVAHFAAFPSALVRRAIEAGTSEAGCCAECGAPFERVVTPTPQYAQHLGHDWADYEQDQEEGRGHFDGASQRPVKRNAPGLAAEYVTTGWVPTCTCDGEPVEAMVTCLKCNGTGEEHEYPRGNEPRRAELVPRGNGWHGVKRDHDGPKFASPQPTGLPCPECGGDGEIEGEVWPDEVLAAWPRVPCTVGDMFAGSGTTGRGALALGRSAVLVDLNPDYCELMEERMAAFPGDVEQIRNGRAAKTGEENGEPELQLQLGLFDL
jgi:DNA modification methylase